MVYSDDGSFFSLIFTRRASRRSPYAALLKAHNKFNYGFAFKCPRPPRLAWLAGELAYESLRLVLNLGNWLLFGLHQITPASFFKLNFPSLNRTSFNHLRPNASKAISSSLIRSTVASSMSYLFRNELSNTNCLNLSML